MRRALLIGSPAKVVEFRRRYGSWGSGLIVAHTIMLPESTLEHSESGDESLNRALNEALQVIRNSRVDDVFVLIPWTAGHAINRAADVLSTSPISIHLAPEPVFDRFSDLRLSRLGTSKTLNLVRPPLNWLEIAEKRIFDIVLGTIALILVSPLLLIIAILIKLDSPGPVFFVQRRHGFNHKRFGILKFRSMTVTEDGAKVEQAKQNDPRVTRVGYYLRRWNLDELPQLINVIKGDMSLVGPRPHALTHNREYERQIAFYARRHNIKPGITGWAQVNGFRGITDTNHKMKARVEHDLYYIDNWSILFDLYILALTVLSPKARQNAY
jgi:Undecaprenyl-phosphate glucose phosphotransferase